MTDDYRHLTVERDGRGVATVWLDVQGRPVNVFDDEVIGELGRAVEELERDPPSLVLFRSRKETGFMAGADIRRIQQIDTEADAQILLGIGQQLFDRIERLPCPTVAVIHGPCLGGGLEFALACRHRVARDDAQTRLGLPEVQLGLLPAWGGTQRLPRVVGTMAALRMILEGNKLPASKAAKMGLADLAAPPDDFEPRLQRFVADRLAGTPLPTRRRGWLNAFLNRTRPGRSLVLRSARRQTAKRGKHYPALPAAINAVETGLRRSHAEGLAVERREFSQLLFSSTSRNLIDLFFQRERARKRSTWVPDEQAKPRAVQRVAVLGGGTMGAGIAQLAAYNGYTVVLKEINDELVAAGRQRIASLMSDAVRKGALRQDEADARLQGVTGTTEWEPLDGTDLAIEAVVEREEIKRDVFRELDHRLAPDAVLASNTSALSIARLGEATGHPQRVAGLHFFNPVHRMPLVEVVRTPATDDAAVATLVEFVRRTGKVPVVVADRPGFIVNRILFPYFDEAVRMVCEGQAADEIDRQAVRFGMPMGPLELLDQVGLDVASDVALTLVPLRAGSSPTPDRLAAMVARGWRGRKSGRGFYEYRKGRRGRPAQWETASPAPPTADTSDDTHPARLTPIQKRLAYAMVNEAARCLEENVVAAAWMVDLAMVLGTGFAPFRGGPLKMADDWGPQRVLHDLDSLRTTHGERFAPCSLLQEMTAEGRTFYESVKSPEATPVGSGS